MPVNNSKVERIIVDLVNELHKIGVVSKLRIAEALGTEEVVIAREMKRYNYGEVAKELLKRPVFLPIDRKRAVYARRRLEDILGKKVIKRRASFGPLDGYLFILEAQREHR